MLKSLRLQYFRQHLDRTFDFGPGLNAIRGENEAGKTTVLEAFTYFCFGATALRESIDDVVTYHQSPSKLRVDGEIEHLGVTYRGYRGKSGAEISFGNEKVTGQREVTKFFERLFGTTAEMAGKLMFASQMSLAESLKAGPTAAGKMIEDLANFDLIDRVAEAIATRRQTGNTTGVEARVATLESQLVEAPAEDLAPLRLELDAASGRVVEAEQVLTALRARRADLAVQRANDVERDVLRLDAAIKQANTDIAQLDRVLKEPALEGPTEKELAVARAAVEEAKLYERAKALHAELARADTAVMWDKDLASLEAEITQTQNQMQGAQEKRDDAAQRVATIARQLAELAHTTDVKIAQLEGRLIKESTCALCQKDLADVPEVVRTNSDLQTQINNLKLETLQASTLLRDTGREAEIERNDAADDVAAFKDYLKDLQAVVAANARIEQLYARAADFITVDRSAVPGAWSWTGINVAAARPDAAGALAKLEREHRAAVMDAATRAEKTTQRLRLANRRDADVIERAGLPWEDARATLKLAAELDQQIRDANIPLLNAQALVQRLQGELRTREALAAQAALQRAQLQGQLLEAKTELATMQKYNLLIKKVRAARPVITNKLWNIVLGGVSKHLSEIRDEPSSITRADGIFKYNGHPCAGLSGSAQDMLGLAMRITLTKTFLPGADMLHLDEPGAACSDARETRMLGLLSTLNFGQIVMISHNPLVDAVADRIINV